jgi:hypothetical protein
MFKRKEKYKDESYIKYRNLTKTRKYRCKKNVDEINGLFNNQETIEKSEQKTEYLDYDSSFIAEVNNSCSYSTLENTSYTSESLNISNESISSISRQIYEEPLDTSLESQIKVDKSDLSKQLLYENSNINVLEFLIAFFSIQTKHHFNKEATSDILKLCSLIMPIPNNFPKNINSLRPFLDSYNVDVKIHKYCQICKESVSVENVNKCMICSNNLVEFQTLDFLSQIKLILKEKSLLNAIIETNRRSELKVENFPIESCFDGFIYKSDQEKKNLGENLISINLNSDGAPAVKSNSFSVWPVLATVLELPQVIRESFRNMILLGKF